MNQETINKVYSLDSKIHNLKQLAYLCKQPVRFKVEGIRCNPNGNIDPYKSTSITIESLFIESELAKIIKKWAIQKIEETQQELELL